MARANLRSRATSRRLGWALLTVVPISWLVLVVWALVNPCSIDCFGWGATRVVQGVWTITAAGVPAGAWLVEISYRNRGESRRPAPPLLPKLLYLFSFLMLMCAIYFGLNLPASLSGPESELGILGVVPAIRTAVEVIVSGVGIAWFLLVGLSTFLVAKVLDERAKPGTSSERLWANATAVSLVVFGGLLVSLVLIEVRVETAEAEILEAEATEIPPPLPTLTPVPSPTPELLPASISDKGSGYDFTDVSVEIRDENSDAGHEYRVLVDGRWMEPGIPRMQTCEFVFFGSAGQRVFKYELPEVHFGTDVPVFEDVQVIVLAESEMDASPTEAKVSCRDHKDA